MIHKKKPILWIKFFHAVRIWFRGSDLCVLCFLYLPSAKAASAASFRFLYMLVPHLLLIFRPAHGPAAPFAVFCIVGTANKDIVWLSSAADNEIAVGAAVTLEDRHAASLQIIGHEAADLCVVGTDIEAVTISGLVTELKRIAADGTNLSVYGKAWPGWMEEALLLVWGFISGSVQTDVFIIP